MNIIEESYRWAYPLMQRKGTELVILHHAAAKGVSARDIHRAHLARGWSGIAYHYYVRSDGKVYRGRPENTVGGHTRGYNWCSIGICFEGNFEHDIMPQEQKEAGLELIAGIKRRYPGIRVGGHREYGATACPGKNFPLDEMKGDVSMTGEEIAKELEKYYARQELPEWAAEEFRRAVEAGISDGTRPMELIPRYQAAIMCLRALEKSRETGKEKA